MRRAYYIIKDYPDEALLEEVRQESAELVDKPVLTKGNFVKHSPVGTEALGDAFRWPRENCSGTRSLWPACIPESPKTWGRRKRSDEEYIGRRIRRVAELVDKPVVSPIGVFCIYRLELIT